MTNTTTQTPRQVAWKLHTAIGISYKAGKGGSTHYLARGQAIPVWDADRLRPVSPNFDPQITVVAMAVDDLGRPIYNEGETQISFDALSASMRQKGSGIADDEMLAICATAKHVELGGASGVTTIRPGLAPIGMGLRCEAISNFNPKMEHEWQPLTLEQGYRVFGALDQSDASARLLWPKLYAEIPKFDDNALVAKNVGVLNDEGECEDVQLVELPLPVCIETPKISRWAIANAAYRLIDSMSLRRVYLGWDLQPAPESGDGGVVVNRVSLDDVTSGKTAMPRRLFALTHGPTTDPRRPLREAQDAALRALLRGDKSPAISDLVPVFPSKAIIETPRPETHAELTDPHLVGSAG